MIQLFIQSTDGSYRYNMGCKQIKYMIPPKSSNKITVLSFVDITNSFFFLHFLSEPMTVYIVLSIVLSIVVLVLVVMSLLIYRYFKGENEGKGIFI